MSQNGQHHIQARVSLTEHLFSFSHKAIPRQTYSPTDWQVVSQCQASVKDSMDASPMPYVHKIWQSTCMSETGTLVVFLHLPGIFNEPSQPAETMRSPTKLAVAQQHQGQSAAVPMVIHSIWPLLVAGAFSWKRCKHTLVHRS
ncbi:hypothetical protein AOLI_G00157400 [Acnodon oligacanthus]